MLFILAAILSGSFSRGQAAISVADVHLFLFFSLARHLCLGGKCVWPPSLGGSKEILSANQRVDLVFWLFRTNERREAVVESAKSGLSLFGFPNSQSLLFTSVVIRCFGQPWLLITLIYIVCFGLGSAIEITFICIYIFITIFIHSLSHSA